MASLKSLTLTALPQIQADPVMDRRNRTIAHLEEQKRLLQDQNYTRTVKVWTEKDGQRETGPKEATRFAVVESSSEWLRCVDGPRRSEAD